MTASPLSPDSPAVLERLDQLLGRLPGASGTRSAGGKLELLSVISGHVNTTLKLRRGDRVLGVRLTVNTAGFRYETGLIKEVPALALLSARRGSAPDDAAAGALIARVLSQPVGHHPGHPLMRRLIHYDWSGTTLPWPFLIHDWAEGTLLWSRPEPACFEAAGHTLAEIHRVRFAACYRDLFAIGRTPQRWSERFRQALAEECRRAAPWLPPALLARCQTVEPPAEQPQPCLVHNDFAGGNLIVGAAGTLTVIDWDNWVVDAPELDLVKLKHWTVLGPDDRLGPHPALYLAFLAGYNSRAGWPLNPQRLRCCEVLWLLRVFSFESARAARPCPSAPPGSGQELTRHYPPTARYLDALSAL